MSPRGQPAAVDPDTGERSAPALSALFERLGAEGRHRILDLAAPTHRSLAVLGGFAEQIRFAGPPPVGTDPTGVDAWLGEWAAPGDPARYDVVLAWDALDRLERAHVVTLIARLAERCAPGALLYTFVRATEGDGALALRTTLLDTGRVRWERVAASPVARAPLLPAELERLLAPFEVVRAFSLRIGIREYLAVRP